MIKKNYKNICNFYFIMVINKNIKPISIKKYIFVRIDIFCYMFQYYYNIYF